MFPPHPPSILPDPPQQPSTRAAAAASADAMRKLREGNQRFGNQTTTAARWDAARRAQVAYAQHPFAIVLGCSDPRVPPEIVFDQGLTEPDYLDLLAGVLDAHNLPIVAERIRALRRQITT